MSPSPVLLPASPSAPLTDLPESIVDFSEPVKLGSGISGVVYKIKVSSNGHSQEVAVKLIERPKDFEQERKTYAHLISRGVRRIIPDVYGYRQWTRSRWQTEFPPSLSWERPSGGGIFMEFLGFNLKHYYDEDVSFNPTFIADYLHIVWTLRKMHVHHKDFGLNLFLVGTTQRLAMLDFAYSTLSLSSEALEEIWKRHSAGILKRCVSP
jgi:hypothetical protein